MSQMEKMPGRSSPRCCPMHLLRPMHLGFPRARLFKASKAYTTVRGRHRSATNSRRWWRTDGSYKFV